VATLLVVCFKPPVTGTAGAAIVAVWIPREAFSTSHAERIVPQDCKLRRVKYLNNVIEQDHRIIKKKVRASQCFESFNTMERTLEGIEAVNMIRKEQVKRLAGSDAQGQAKFVGRF
jgi:transposase-like protein